MDIIQAMIFGIVEGITEFLPVSSTFHLIWTGRLLNLEQTEFLKLFEVFIQSGAILAVVFLYWKEILFNAHLFKKLVLSFIPTALIGFGLYKIIKGVFFESEITMVVIFILVGIAFLIIEYRIQKGTFDLKNDISKLTMKQAVLVGLFQALAVMPGVSRAGAVMIGMMFMGFKRSEAAKYSFMLAIPTIIAASVLDLIQMREVVMANTNYLPMLFVGSFVAFLSALVVVKYLIKFLQTNSLNIFGWYRVIIGIILLLVFLR